MKKMLIPCLLALLSLQTFSQKRDPAERESLIRVGFKGGLNINKIQGQSFKDAFKYNYQVGGFVQINLPGKIGFQPEVNFAQSTSEQSNDITVIYDDLFLGGSQAKAKLNYLKLAGLLNVDIGPSQRVKLQVGPQWAILLNEDIDNLKQSRNVFKDGDFSMLGGLMIQLPFIHIGGRYELGLTNINGIDNKDQWKSQAWQLFIGFTL